MFCKVSTLCLEGQKQKITVNNKYSYFSSSMIQISKFRVTA